MSEQPQQQQPTSKAPAIMYLVVWFLFMIWLSLPEGESFAKSEQKGQPLTWDKGLTLKQYENSWGSLLNSEC